MKKYAQTQKLKRKLRDADTYESWLDTARRLDAHLHNDRWRADENTHEFDAERLREHIARLKGYRLSGSVGALLEFLPESLYQNLNDLNVDALYQHAFAGTKLLTEDYFKEAVTGIEYLADTEIPGWSVTQKVRRFRQAVESFGRTALLLSGGATLGYYHLGVARALWCQGLLPTVISGSSMGAIIASSICTRADQQLGAWFDEAIYAPGRSLTLQGPIEAFRSRALMRQDVLRHSLERAIPDLTFAEAFEVSGRVLNITVSPTRRRQKPRLLNHRTAPDVFVLEACLASAAVPGLFPPVTLSKKTASGRRVDYLPSEKWSDGSLTVDLPKRRLSRLQNVNHFIVSQTNPHVLPFVHAATGLGPATRLTTAVGTLLRGNAHAALQAGARILKGTRIEALLANAESFVAQDYDGDITIHPQFDAALYLRMFSNPSPEVMARFIREGERATWPHIEKVRLQTMIGRSLQRVIRQLEGDASLSV